jgi:hypothetical protein
LAVLLVTTSKPNLSLAIVFLGWILATGHYAFFPVTLVIGYAFAWVGHFFFEHNRPATFTYPRWSFMADFWMISLFYTGKLPAEVRKYQS